jgi:hypothetical protein
VSSNNKKLTLEEVILRAKKIHGDAYDYSKVVYKSYNDNIEIICKTTGKSFLATPANHINLGTRCPCCYGATRRTTESFVEKALEIWGQRFDYSNVVYINNHTKVNLRCIEHDFAFKQAPKKHLLGQNGCQVCTNKTPITTEIFTKLARAVHGETYDYSLVNYVGTDKKVKIICHEQFINSEVEHGIFEQTPHNHISLRQNCPISSKTKSKPEIDLLGLLEGFDVKYRAKILNNKRELDIYVPSLKLGIEYNGLYWHSEEKKTDKNYHALKTEECKKLGIRLIHIFEDEWLEKREIVTARIKSILGRDTRTYARNTIIKELSWKETAEFLDKKHIQGAGRPTGRNIGLFLSDALVAVMTFSELRFEEKEKNVYELVRYCSEGTVVGGFSKLLNHFIKSASPKKIISYSDRRWSIGEVYFKNGFNKVATTDPGYFWVKSKKRFSRFMFQKHKLKDKLEKFDENLTEEQNCIMNGYSKIWDCGHDKWELII